ncbi:hypothetical protein [Polyangium sorediatum]|uniref:Uncharacterized protein n=1 Tax=Polyangium sorediatum TaxID=889274 RepID=A0ABT6P4A2_9BACT|nr:hypothetical protein [Polyangium sorediatum]MDI1435446.1 hypothetical protein [Polyangium sorediatum]
MAALDAMDPERRPLLPPVDTRAPQAPEQASPSDATSGCCGCFVGVWRIFFGRDPEPQSVPSHAEPTEASVLAEDVATAAESSPRARSPITAATPCLATEPVTDAVQAIEAPPPPPPPQDNGEGSRSSAPRAELTPAQKEAFKAQFEEHAAQRKTNGQDRMGRSQYILLSDLMSGDSRLVGLYASYFNYPILYLQSRENASKRDFTHEYLQELGVTVFKHEVDEAQKVYNESDLASYPGLGIKAAHITEKVADILGDKNKNPLVSRDAFLGHVKSKLHREDTPAGLHGLLSEQRPVLVLWTKAKVTNLYTGKPEHLLGNTGTQQILELARANGFATAIAGDLKLKQGHRDLMDHDLRFVEEGKLKGLSLKDQYAALQRISRSTTLVHLGMRSGQLEPLPLLCMHTIYLEEVNNGQAVRMQKLASVTDLYERRQFAIPPTAKGRFNQAFTYFWEKRYQRDARERETPEGDKAVKAMHQAVMQTRKDAGERMRDVGQGNAAQVFEDFKKTPAASGVITAFPRGFLPEDREKIDHLLKGVKLKIALHEAAGNVRALKAALPSVYPP